MTQFPFLDPDATIEEAEARERVFARSEKRRKQTEADDHIRLIVREEISKQLQPIIWTLALVALMWWRGPWIGAGIWLGLVISYAVLYTQIIEDRKPGAGEPVLADLDAEHYVRHCILADLERKKDLNWEIEDGSVVVADHQEWRTFWRRLELVVPDFEKGSPKYRRQKMAEAKRRSLSARIAMNNFAKTNEAKPLWWARLNERELRLASVRRIRALWRRSLS